MFIIMINYQASISVIDQHLDEHREFLDQCYKNNFFMVAGPRTPRTGGIIISQLSDIDKLEKVLKKDPFIINHFVNYEIIAFTPTKYHKDFANFIND